MIKRMASCIREFRKETILTPLLVSLEVVIDVIIPLIMANLIDLGVSAGRMDMIVKLGLALLLKKGLGFRNSVQG